MQLLSVSTAQCRTTYNKHGILEYETQCTLILTFHTSCCTSPKSNHFLTKFSPFAKNSLTTLSLMPWTDKQKNQKKQNKKNNFLCRGNKYTTINVKDEQKPCTANLFYWHPVFHDLSITTQNFKRCINLSVLDSSIFLHATLAKHSTAQTLQLSSSSLCSFVMHQIHSQPQQNCNKSSVTGFY